MSMFQFTKEDLLRGIELGIMFLLGLVVLFLVVRPLVRRVLSSEQLAAPTNPALLAAAVAGAAAAGSPLSPDMQAAIAQVDTTDLKAVPSHTAKMIDIAQVQGQVHAQSVQKVGELADKNPNETVSIIRQWLHDSAA